MRVFHLLLAYDHHGVSQGRLNANSATLPNMNMVRDYDETMCPILRGTMHPLKPKGKTNEGALALIVSSIEKGEIL